MSGVKGMKRGPIKSGPVWEVSQILAKGGVSRDTLRKLFHYNPDTGEFTRKMMASSRTKVGDQVGSLDITNGYFVTKLGGAVYHVHRLIWIWMEGCSPDRLIHHINGIGTDNRWSNLQLGLHISKSKRIGNPLTQERVRELLNYNPETGVVTRNTPLSKGMNQHSAGEGGDLITSISNKGYFRVCIDGNRYLLHRVIFLLIEGYTPEGPIDHINRITTDNRWSNLRPVSHMCNVRNTGMFSHNTSGVKGVSWYSKPKKWCSSIKVNGKNIRLGQFTDIVEAAAHRLAAEQALDWHGCDSCSPAYQYMQAYLQYCRDLQL